MEKTQKKIKVAIFFGFLFFVSLLFFSGPFVNVSMAAGSVIPNTSVTSVDSEQSPLYLKANAADNNNSTMWCTQFVGGMPAHPHQIVLDLGKNYLVGGLRYLPRQDGYFQGIITKYEIYVSEDGVSWGTKTSSGTWFGTATEKETIFSEKIGRYVKFVSLAEAVGINADCAAEIKILGFNSDGTAIETTPSPAPIATQGSPLPVPNTSVTSVDSEQSPLYLKANAADNNNSTMWCTQFVGGMPAHPHQIVLDLGKNYLVGGLRYLPRQDGYFQGIITKYEIYVSEDGVSWGTKTSSGTWFGTATEKETIFSEKIGRYVKFVSLAEAVGINADCAAEIKILGFNSDGTAIETTPSPAPIATQGSPLPVPNTSVTSVDSEQSPLYLKANAADNNNSTMWCTQFVGGMPAHPHQIVLDLGKNYLVGGLRYLPRQDGYFQGIITKYEIYVSEDGVSWGTKTSSGTWFGTATEKETIFSEKIGRYVKFVSLAEAVGINADCAAEIKILGFNSDGTAIEVNNGPEIPVGLWNYTEADLTDSYFKIKANKDYVIKDKDGDVDSEVLASIITKVKYGGDKDLLAYGSIQDRLFSREVQFEAKDGNNSDMIFDVYRPSSDYDQYRGKIKLRYTDSSNIWVINTLPMEQYVWGMGETTGTGPFEHTKLMTAIFRTYGYQYITWTSTVWVPYGFRIRSDSGSQIYSGYDHEIAYPNVKIAADATRGKIATYQGGVALTPYSSWSDGRTRSFEERWGSTDYPWCQSVSDPYGKHPTMTTAQLEAAGNHMVGTIANGSLKLAGSSYNWDYQKILKYYYTGIDVTSKY